jgi:Ca2+-binding EF-hand superfamily protein
MKNITLSLLAALTLATPAIAHNLPRFERMDLNKDGYVTLEEAFATCKIKSEVFDYADENHDGKLTVDEVRRNFFLFDHC